MAPRPEKIWDLAVDVKEAVIAGFEEACIDLPDRRVVTPGLPAWDCEMLAVQVEASIGQEGNIASEVLAPLTPAAGHALRAIRVAVWLLRCVPTVREEGMQATVPSVQEEERAAETILTDHVVMLNSIVAAQRAGTLPGCGGVVFEQWTNVGPQGGLGGGVLRMRLGLG